MMFVTFITASHERYPNLSTLLKKMHKPENINILGTYILLGKPDAMIIYEAPDEVAALKFVEEFVSVGDVQTNTIVKAESL
ncbi:MAG: hypothetical protein ACP5F1_06325 [Thermoplasmata archaeon]|nr:hypothetical protein [Thermoplasmata archaeon]